MTTLDAVAPIPRRRFPTRCGARVLIASVAAQVVLLAAAQLTIGLSGPARWAAGAHLAVLLALVLRGLRRSGLAALGMANAITLARAQLTGVVLAVAVTLAGQPGTEGIHPVVPSAVVLAAVSLLAVLLDGVDGLVARRTDTCTTFGARFDVEADAFLVLVLAAHVAGQVGWWALAIGAMRYLYVAAAWPMPWLAAPLPPRDGRRLVGLVQGLVLLVVATGALPGPIAATLLIVSLALLVCSFGRDVWWLATHRR